MNFRGAFTALVTPLSDQRVDEPALTKIVEHQIAAGINGLVPCGTTGESATLALGEHIRAIEAVLKCADGRVPVIAGAGSNCTRSAIETTRACKEMGVAATLHVTPYYNKPNQDCLRRHFLEIADRVGHPLFLYNVPSRTQADLLPETVADLAKHPMILGIKEATGDMHRASQIRELCGDDFILLTGDDFSILPFMSVGGDGVISVVSNILPKVVSQLCSAADAGRWDEAKKLHNEHLPLTRALFTDSNPIPVKAAMSALGYCKPDLNLPLYPMDLETENGRRLLAELKACGAMK